MSQIHDGPLATYCSLTDKNLAGYFSNTKMRRHLKKAGLVDRRGQIISENQYRLNMARKEHKKHVKDLLAQAIVHKTLDIERNRQVEIKRKLEEIAKLEVVRRVRATKFRKGDEDILPYLSPRSSRPQSRSGRYRPQSAPADRQYNDSYDADVIYVDDEGRPVTPPKDLQDDHKREEIDTRHLYALDSAALKKYALTLSKIEQGEGMTSPYLISQVPSPPRSARGSARNNYRDARFKSRLQRPRTANSLSPYRSTRTGAVQGTLMLHRQEPAMMHQGEVQTLCEVTMKYYGPNLILPRDQRDPTQDIEIEQQHCGGNTLPVFKERIKPGDEFTFISRRHRGYPFSLSIFVDGRISARVSTCCEYGHAKGVRLGGKMGQFCLKNITGATPCYKCKLNAQASPRTLKRPTSKKRQQKVEQIKEEIIVVRKEQKNKEEEEAEDNVVVPVEGAGDDDDDKTRSHKAYIKTDTDSDRSDNKINDNKKQNEDNYDDDFEDEDSGSKKDSGTEKYKDDFESDEETKPKGRRSRSSSSSSSSSRSRSRSPPPRSHTPTPKTEEVNDREIYGLRADEDTKKDLSDDERSEKDKPVKLQSYSDEDEQPESKKWIQREPVPPKRKDSTSSSSSSSSAKSRDSQKPIKEEERKTEEIKPTVVTIQREPVVEKRKERRSSTSSSSSSSSSSTDSRREKFKRQLSREEIRKKDHQSSIDQRREEERKKEEEARLKEEQKQLEIERKRREEDEERRRHEEESRVREEKRLADQKRREQELEEERKRREEERQEKEKREIYAKRKQTENLNSTPRMDYIPEAPSYSKMYEQEVKAANRQVEAEREVVTEKPRSTRNRSSSDTSSASERSTPKRVASPKVSRPASSSSSSSDSDTDTEKEKGSKVTPPRTPSPAKVTPPRSRTVSSSSSSSSDTETETDAEKKVVKSITPASTPKKSSDSSSSETETTTDTDQKSPKSITPPETKAIKEEKESSSSSSSESESNNEKTPRAITPPRPGSTLPHPIEANVVTTSRPKTDESSSSSDSETETGTETGTATETETDNEKLKKEAEQQKQKLSVIQEKEKKSTTGSSSSSSGTSSSETETETDRSQKQVPVQKTEEVQKTEVVQKTEQVQKKEDEKKDTTTTTDDSSSGSSSDSSSDSSDSEEEDKQKTAEKMKEILTKDDVPVSEAPPVDNQEKIINEEPFISESEGEQMKAATIFASESEDDNMHGGNDPDNLATSHTEVKSTLTKIGITPPQLVEGTILSSIEGKRDLELNNIALSSSQVTEICDVLSKEDNLQSVCLRNSGIDDEKFTAIANALKTTESKPLMLNFNLNKLRSGSADKLVEILSGKPSIQILLLHGNPLGDDGVKQLVNGILDIKQASNQNKMEEQEVDGAKTRETTKHHVLRELDLGDTEIGDVGMGHVAHLLENDSGLTTLNLNGNSKVSYTGWKRLSKALKRNKTLQSLTLDFNKIGDEGVAALVNSLKVNTNLQTLDLESTGISDEGGRLLIDLVKCNTTILDITVMPGNKISEKTQEEIRNYLGLNKAASSDKMVSTLK
ncbi:uncharacterized protein LOC143054004 isoform X1 [Mytilus galloprovincialis]|uniref:uncharacterized protein LOC143054004 isoform X1 n=1 Tax=Mytilus galloprovincialis TaxID=29158 RepID=UPI003F7C07CF